MKKVVLTLMLTAAMVLTMSATVFAEIGSFVESPSANQAPELVSSSNSSEDCESEIVIASYGDRHLIDEEGRQEIEKAYNRQKKKIKTCKRNSMTYRMDSTYTLKMEESHLLVNKK